MQNGEAAPKAAINFNVNHVAIAVPPGTLEDVVKWYFRHFGLRRVSSSDFDFDLSKKGPENPPPFETAEKPPKRLKAAMLSTGNGVGFEIFEFIDPPAESLIPESKEWTMRSLYQRGGLWHMGFTVGDVEATVAKVVEDRGERVADILNLAEGEKAILVRDPWGNLLELLSSSFEQMFANRW